MKKELKGSMAFDASILLELLLSTEGGRIVRDALLKGELFGYATELAIVEAKYVLCRRLGWEEAAKRINWLILSGFVEVEDVSYLCDLAAKYKCEMAIALSDCFTLSLAKTFSIPALFARRERELVEELKKARLDVEVLFLEDFVSGSSL